MSSEYMHIHMHICVYAIYVCIYAFVISTRVSVDAVHIHICRFLPHICVFIAGYMLTVCIIMKCTMCCIQM